MSKASQLRQKAQTFLKKGKIDKAIEEYKKLLSVESRNPNLYNELGDIYLRASNRVQAVSAFEKASANYEQVALYNNAVAVCKKILRIVPNRIETIFKLGELKGKQKLLGEAENYFSQYFDAIIGDPELIGEEIQERVEGVLEAIPDCEGIWSKASDVFSHLGVKSRAAEILAELIARNSLSGDPQKVNFYRSRLDLLKQALKRDEIEKIDAIISVATDGAPGVETSSTEDASGPAADLSSKDIKLTDYASEVAGDQDAATGEPAAVETEHVIEEEPAAVETEHVIEEEPAAAETDDVIEEEPAAAETEHVIEEETGNGAVEASGSGDLSDLLEEEDAIIESESSIKNLAEEITSNVEEDDFRSHYDLGMAYIEMGLFSDAVKELQISARSEQLQLQSLEMVGLCFLSMDTPALAVKQLERGLQISEESGGESMGIHYNLGLAFEALDEPEKAREHFEEVYIVDVTFRDISEKMKKFSTVS
ncbi:MAG: tetratricopeptide repeat protein [Candidatus Krumholzibacteria bacterium]|nr:tetratricopeptide repeat protein [Candidatus Krumholzibacteria bacterium]